MKVDNILFPSGPRITIISKLSPSEVESRVMHLLTKPYTHLLRKNLIGELNGNCFWVGVYNPFVNFLASPRLEGCLNPLAGSTIIRGAF